MIPLEDAQAHVLDRCERLAPVTIGLGQARGRVITADAVCSELVPPFANTGVDGYAVRAADTAGATTSKPVRLRVTETLAAGHAARGSVGPGEAIRIMTGAPLPDGADAAVMVEWTMPAGEDGVLVSRPIAPGAHIREAGEDMRPGSVVVAAGALLGPPQLGVLATIGQLEVSVYPGAKVGVFSTGDELVQGGGPLAPGQIRDSNRWSLIALVQEAGGEVEDLGVLPDDEAVIRDAIRSGAARCDALVSSGGVSMGDFDYVKKVLDEVGDMRWMQIAIKPAKPLAFGLVGGTPVFGLPGNPVSSMVSFELFARPALRKMMGRSPWHRARARGLAAERLGRAPDDKVHFNRVAVDFGPDGELLVRNSGGQGSHQLHAMSEAAALAVLPDGDGVAAGGAVELIFLGTGPYG